MPEIRFALVLPTLAVVSILLWAICMFRINRRIVQVMVFWLAYACLLWYIFSCGLYRPGDVLNIYYGACDECVCLGRITLQDVFESLGV